MPGESTPRGSDPPRDMDAWRHASMPTPPPASLPSGDPQNRPDAVQPAGDAPRAFRAGTILVPVGGMAVHFILSLLVFFAWTVGLAFSLARSEGISLQPALEEATRLLTEEWFARVAAVYSALQLLVFVPVLRVLGRQDPRALLLEKPRISDMIPSIPVMIGAMGVTALYFFALTALRPVVPFIDTELTNYEALQATLSGDDHLWIQVLGICLLVPVAEEVLFRGIIQGELRRAMPEGAAVAIQALLFALFHMSFVQSTYVLLPAVLLGLVYAWTRSLWVPILMHSVFNLMGTVLPRVAEASEAVGTAVVLVELAFILVGVICLVWIYTNRRTGPYRAAARKEAHP